jgi:hypothetical protein
MLRDGEFSFEVDWVLLVAVQVVEVRDVLFELIDLAGVLFLLLSELIDFTSQTDSLAVKLNHDGPPDIVIDFPQLIRVDNLLD